MAGTNLTAILKALRRTERQLEKYAQPIPSEQEREPRRIHVRGAERQEPKDK